MKCTMHWCFHFQLGLGQYKIQTLGKFRRNSRNFGKQSIWCRWMRPNFGGGLLIWRFFLLDNYHYILVLILIYVILLFKKYCKQLSKTLFLLFNYICHFNCFYFFKKIKLLINYYNIKKLIKNIFLLKIKKTMEGRNEIVKFPKL